MFHYSNHAYADTLLDPMQHNRSAGALARVEDNNNSAINRATRLNSTQISDQSTFDRGTRLGVNNNNQPVFASHAKSIPAIHGNYKPDRNSKVSLLSGVGSHRFEASYYDALNGNIAVSDLSAVQDRNPSERGKQKLGTSARHGLPAVEAPLRRAAYPQRCLDSPFSIQKQIEPSNGEHSQMSIYSSEHKNVSDSRVRERSMDNEYGRDMGLLKVRAPSQIDFKTSSSRLMFPVGDDINTDGPRVQSRPSSAIEDNNCYSPRLEESNVSGSYNLRHSDLSYRQQWERLRSTPTKDDRRTPLRAGPERQYLRPSSVRDLDNLDVCSSIVPYSPSAAAQSRFDPNLIENVTNSPIRTTLSVVQLERNTSKSTSLRRHTKVTPQEIIQNDVTCSPSTNVTVDTLLLRERNKSWRLAVYGSLLNQAFLAIVSLVMCFLGLQVLLRLNVPRSGAAAGDVFVNHSFLINKESVVILRETAVAAVATVIGLNLWCFVTSCLNWYCTTKLVSEVGADERALRFMKTCTVTRVISVVGFFLSIPLFIFGLILYIILEYSLVSAIICVVVLSLSIVCIVVTVAQTVHFWRKEQQQHCNHTSEGEVTTVVGDVRTNKQPAVSGGVLNQCELSTLV